MIKLIQQSKILILILLLVFQLQNMPKVVAGSENWQLVRNENGIKVYTYDSEHSDILKAKASAVINAPLEIIKNILDDIDNRHHWVPYLQKSVLLETLPDHSRIEYSIFYAPWPAFDRDFVYRLNIAKESENYIHYEMSSVISPLMEDQPWLVRAELFESSYTLTRLSETKTRLEVVYHADPKGWLPSWIVNIIQEWLPYKIIVNLRAESAREIQKEN